MSFGEYKDSDGHLTNNNPRLLRIVTLWCKFERTSRAVIILVESAGNGTQDY
jgi:hypothetical protein